MNYFDHEENVKFVDGILEYSQEWQWLFDYIDKRYVFEEPKSWHEFVDNSYSIRELIVRFEKIRNVCAKEWIINNSIIKEGWELAKFYNGRIDIVTCQKSINSLTGKLMLLVLWITKLLNIDNGTDYDFNIGMLQEKNYFQLVNIDEIIKNLDEINEFIDNISITGIDEIKKCLNDNVHYIKYDIGAEAEEKIRKRANTYNAFRFDSIRTNLGATWQEDTIFMLLSMINPILFSNLTMSYDQNKILKEMMKAAENPLIMLVSNIEISEVFPREGAKVNYKRHDIDAKFLEIISEIVENKGYKLLNKMLPEKFVAYIYQNCKIELQLNITLFNEEEKMYNLIKAKAPIELLEYDKKISLAMITQLFPVLEMQIRKLVSYLGIFPYKIDEEEFMQCNDPSSLLRELLLQIYNEQKSFENVSDIMFVYNSMYNSNFLNIRNECIHGRDYLAGGKLRYAFRVTLLCIYMVMFRIDTIEEKVSDLID